MTRLVMAIVVVMLVVASVPGDASAQPYTVIKAGMMMVDAVGVSVDNPINVGVAAGYGFGDGEVSMISIEGEYTFSVVDGSIAGADFDISTMSAAVVFRSTGDLYGMAKVGFARETISAAGRSVSESGLTFGGGLGFRMGESAAIEVEYTLVEEDVSFVSGGVAFSF